MFQLDKWYLDLVADDDSAFVGYVARLRWGAITVRWASTLHSPATGSQPVEAVHLGGSGTIGVNDGVGTWLCPALRVDGQWQGSAPAVGQTLWSEPRGTVEWSGLLPSARALVQLGDTRLEGYGYVEHVTLTLRPWQLPFDRLWWGRYATSSHAITWIAWDGSTRRQWVWIDGADYSGAVLTERGIEGLPGGAVLRLHASRDLHRRRVMGLIAPHLPALAGRLGEKLSGLQEHKQVSRGSLYRDGAVVDEGWAIHEEVTW